MWLQLEEYVGPEAPIMPENPTEIDKLVCEYKMNALLKTMQVLKVNPQSLFTVLMALCDTEVKNLVKALSEFKDINNKTGFHELAKGKSKKKIIWYKCNKDGHYSNECDEEDMAKTGNKKWFSFLVIKREKGRYSDVDKEYEEEVDKEYEEEAKESHSDIEDSYEDQDQE